MRFLHWLISLILFLVISIATIFYLYDCENSVQEFFENVSFVNAWILQGTKSLEKFHISPFWGLVGSIGLFVFYIFLIYMRRRNKTTRVGSPSAFFSFILPAIIVMAVGIYCYIYFHPTGNIKLGNIFTVKRGDPGVFLDKTIHIILLVVTFHVLLFLLIFIYRNTFFQVKIKRKPRLEKDET